MNLQALADALKPADRARVAAAMADWKAIRDKHGDAGMFAFALVALNLKGVE